MIFTHQLYIDTLTAQNTDRGFKTTLQANNHKVLKVIFLSLLPGVRDITILVCGKSQYL